MVVMDFWRMHAILGGLGPSFLSSDGWHSEKYCVQTTVYFEVLFLCSPSDYVSYVIVHVPFWHESNPPILQVSLHHYLNGLSTILNQQRSYFLLLKAPRNTLLKAPLNVNSVYIEHEVCAYFK